MDHPVRFHYKDGKSKTMRETGKKCCLRESTDEVILVINDYFFKTYIDIATYLGRKIENFTRVQNIRLFFQKHVTKVMKCLQNLAQIIFSGRIEADAMNERKKIEADAMNERKKIEADAMNERKKIEADAMNERKKIEADAMNERKKYRS